MYVWKAGPKVTPRLQKSRFAHFALTLKIFGFPFHTRFVLWCIPELSSRYWCRSPCLEDNLYWWTPMILVILTFWTHLFLEYPHLTHPWMLDTCLVSLINELPSCFSLISPSCILNFFVCPSGLCWTNTVSVLCSATTEAIFIHSSPQSFC